LGVERRSDLDIPVFSVSVARGTERDEVVKSMSFLRIVECFEWYDMMNVWIPPDFI